MSDDKDFPVVTVAAPDSKNPDLDPIAKEIRNVKNAAAEEGVEGAVRVNDAKKGGTGTEKVYVYYQFFCKYDSFWEENKAYAMVKYEPTQNRSKPADALKNNKNVSLIKQLTQHDYDEYYDDSSRCYILSTINNPNMPGYYMTVYYYDDNSQETIDAINDFISSNP